jgi:hypothetical protein
MVECPFDYITVRYDAATGQQTWVQRYGLYEYYDYEGATDIAVDNRGGVYVTGSSGDCVQCTFFLTMRYNALTGEEVWVQPYYQSEDNQPVRMALDHMGNLIITGRGNTSYSSEFEGESVSFITLKYSQGEECPNLAETSITGSTTAAVNSSNSYSLANTVASSFTWSITDSDGNSYTDFTGQGTSSITVDWPSAPGLFKVSVSYGGPGGGCVVSTAVMYVHVFDPRAGFVTGGGWSDSPVTPDYELMHASGSAYWGFVAKYKDKGSDHVQGLAVVLLESGPYAFRSTDVQDGSLVIDGDRAYFRGRGALTHREGSGTRTDTRRFGYLVSAIDGDHRTGKGRRDKETDRLRLKVWVIGEDGSEGALVYDNQAGCPLPDLDDNTPACAAIDKGSIVIHKSGIKSLSDLFALSAAEDLQAQRLQAYPTVFSDRTTLAFATGSDTDYTLELYDLKGALVRKIAADTAEAGKYYENELVAQGMEQGIYIAKLTTATKVQAVKLILQQQ